MTDVVQTVENVVGAVPAEVVTVAKAVETKVEAVVVPVAKTVADFAVDEVAKAALALEEAKNKALAIRRDLETEIFVKKNEIALELAKLEPVFVSDIKAVEKVVETAHKDVEKFAQDVEAVEVSFVTKHPVAAAIAVFLSGVISGGLVIWSCL